MPMHQREQEWQFSAEGLDATRAWLAEQPQAFSERRFTANGVVDLHDTYFDSDDWRIFRAGFALRLRQAREDSGVGQAELTLKSLTPSRGGFANRAEFSEAVNAADMHAALEGQGQLRERVRSLLGGRKLVLLFSARTRRERLLLREADSDVPLAELDLDLTSIDSPSGAQRELVRVELECLNAVPAALAPIVEQLRDAANLVPATESKFRTGLDVAGLTPSLPQPIPKRDVSAKQVFLESQLAVLALYFDKVLKVEPEVRAGTAEAIHVMRVSARHLDVLLKAFAPYGPLWAVRSRAAIRELVKMLGRVRDCDVQLAFLRESAGKFSVHEREHLAPISDRLEQERRDARSSLLNLLDSHVHPWMEAWQRELAVATPDTLTPQASTAQIAQELIRAQARKLRKSGERLDESSTADDFHEVRIRAKHLRYILDAFAPLYGRAGSDFLNALTKLQDILGNYQDSSIRVSRFTALAASGGVSAATSFALGRLVESDVKAHDRCREKFAKTWRRVRGRRWRALREVMETLAEGAS